MNKWYRSNWLKGLLCIVVCLSMITIAVCGVTIISGVNNNITWHDITHNKTQSYEQSEGFANTLNDSEFKIISQLRIDGQFETDGKYDENKLVDVKEFTENGTVSGINDSGFAYTVGQLTSWYSSTASDTGNTVYVVCKKPDDTYHYYTFDEFKKSILNGELTFNVSEDDSISNDDILTNLYNGIYGSDSTSKVAVLSKNENNETQMIYSDCWTLISSISEIYAPQGADSILDIANDDSRWNGKLSDMVSYLDTTIGNISENYSDYETTLTDYSEGNTNLAYLFVDKTNHKVYSNRSAYLDYDKAEANIKALKKLGAYVVITPDLKGFETNLDTSAINWQQHQICLDGENTSTDFTYVLAVDTTFPIQDSFYTNNEEYNAFMPYIIPMMIISLIAFVIFLIALVWMTIISGRSNRTGNIILNGFDKIWTEVALVLVVGIWILAMYCIADVWDSFYLSTSYYTTSTRIGAAVMTVVVSGTLITAGFFLVGWLSLVRRIKAGTIWRNSVLRKLCHLVIRIFRAVCRFLRTFWDHRQQTTKVVLVSIILFFLHIFAGLRGAWDGWPIFLVMIVDIAICVYLIHQIVTRNRIKTGIREISEGNVTYRIDTKGLRGNDLEIATLVNNIGNGLHAAVNQSMKDERMKADLITNVSHDIKTPLTSIINYVDLLKRENFTDPKVVGYIEILEQKAQRLKTLTEDVVEASKVSSGNVTLEMMNINLVEMLNQIEGEFIEKFESRNLSVVMSKPQEAVIIYADGRRLSRILENIYNNAYKYAMEGTRIYADLAFVDGKAKFSLKNISEQALNISADELTERFIRGDVSRTTEGSGLGLSIAKSLTELQGGTFELYLDGDLFKVTITFPVGK